MEDNFKSKLYDPNGNLSEHEVWMAHIAGGTAFLRCGIKPKQLVDDHCKTLVYGEMGSKKYLVYVRVTRSKDEEDGTGAMPLALIDEANKIGAEPHVVRVNLIKQGKGVGLEYWGLEDLERALKSNTGEWHSLLLKGKTVADFHRLVKGKISRLELKVETVPYDKVPCPEEIQLRKMFNEPVEDKRKGPPCLSVKLLVDGQEVLKAPINLASLAASCCQNDEHFIFACTCGIPECTGIYRGVVVVTENGFTVWKVHGLKHKRVFVFDHRQYKAEVLEKLKAFSKCCKMLDPQTQKGSNDTYYVQDLKHLQKAIYELEQTDSTSEGQNNDPLPVRIQDP